MFIVLTAFAFQCFAKEPDTVYCSRHKTKDIVLKMVNLLPVIVLSEIDLNGIMPAKAQASKFVLQGSNPSDKTAKPVESNIAVFGKFNNELPPYSFTVIRIKTVQ